MKATTPEQARQAGERAAEEGRSIDRCPQYGSGDACWKLRTAWRAGWNEKNIERGRKLAR